MVVSTGRTRSKASRSQPAKMAMLPVAARWQPPDTGQSTGSAPTASTRAPIRRTSDSSVVLISIQTLPAESPAMTPSSASMTAEQAVGDGRQVITTSHRSAISLGESAHPAPPSRNAWAASRSRSRTIRSYPLRVRLPANFPPTLPSPMNPIRMARLPLLDGGAPTWRHVPPVGDAAENTGSHTTSPRSCLPCPNTAFPASQHEEPPAGRPGHLLIRCS